MALPNCLRCLRVLGRGFVGALRHAQRQRGNGDAAAVENLQAVDEALALFAQQILRRHTAIAEHHFGGVAGAHAQLVFFLSRTESRRSLLDEERGDAVRILGAIGDRHGHADVGVVPVGGEGLGAVEHPVAAGLASATVRVPPASEPASGSVSDQQPSFFPPPAGRDISASALRCRICKCDSSTANCAPRRSARPNHPRAPVPR